MGVIHANAPIMRALSGTEVALASGDSDDEPTTLGTVTVHGQLGAGGGFFVSLGGSWGGGGIGGEHRDHADPIRDDSPVQNDPDKEEVEITVNIQRALTQSERNALDALADAVSDASIAINAIPDNAEITLSNGAKVTGAELKEVWGKTDFTINERGTSYQNGTFRGEADYNGGDPRVSINIDNVEGYAANGAGGMNYLVLHELGHMTAAGRASNQLNVGAPENSPGWIRNERIANDTAHAIADSFGMSILGNPDAGYSSSIPIFTVPSPPPPPPPSGGGGGPGGGGPRQPFLMWYDL